VQNSIHIVAYLYEIVKYKEDDGRKESQFLFHFVWYSPAVFLHLLDLFFTVVGILSGAFMAIDQFNLSHIMAFDKIERQIEEAAEPEDFDIPEEWQNGEIPLPDQNKPDNEASQRAIANEAPKTHEADIQHFDKIKMGTLAGVNGVFG
jgi:hypothetical protein